MSLTASISIINCPMCSEVVRVTGIRVGNEPELNITRCENCKTELQVSKDLATGKMRAERVKSN